MANLVTPYCACTRRFRTTRCKNSANRCTRDGGRRVELPCSLVLKYGTAVMITRPISLTNNHDPPVCCTNGTLIGVPASIRAVVGVTCILSMAGALLIILSYILIKEIRTTTRKILLHLSIMDFVVAAGNGIGLFQLMKIHPHGRKS